MFERETVFECPYFKDLSDDPLDSQEDPSPTLNDCQWLLDTIEGLCMSSKQSYMYNNIVHELKSRGFIPDKFESSTSYPPPRSQSPFNQAYNPIEIIGEGGYGKVLKVFNLIDQQIYALKIVDVNPDEVSSAVHEVQCLAHLNSPRIVRYYSSWIESTEALKDLQLFIQMEFVRGIPLSTLLDSHRPMSSQQQMSLIREMILALRDIHSQGIVHRDFKPANIMIRSDGGICILDFGISSIGHLSTSFEGPSQPTVGSFSSKPLDKMVLDAAESQFATVKSVGTPIYASPRQLQGHRSSSEDDMYSLGIIMFEILGQFKTTMEKSKAIKNLRSQKQFPPGFEAQHPNEACIIRQLISNDRHSRPSADDLLSSGLFPEETTQ